MTLEIASNEMTINAIKTNWRAASLRIAFLGVASLAQLRAMDSLQSDDLQRMTSSTGRMIPSRIQYGSLLREIGTVLG